jgi:ribosomal protein S27E
MAGFFGQQQKKIKLNPRGREESKHLKVKCRACSQDYRG